MGGGLCRKFKGSSCTVFAATYSLPSFDFIRQLHQWFQQILREVVEVSGQKSDATHDQQQNAPSVLASHGNSWLKRAVSLSFLRA